MTSGSPHHLRESVLERARLLGLEHVGIARADLPLEVDHERYARFVDANMFGDMAYLAEDIEARRRLDGDAVLPGAKSVVCIAKPYARSGEAEEHDPATARLIARYARGQDYHNHFRKKLRRLAKFIRALAPGVSARPLCDVEPVLERAWAARAGLGFVGKNGLVIVPGRGSFVLLGEVVTTLDLEPDVPMTERCGSCTRCLDACPTEAFAAPFVLDPRKCIAYLTIESPNLPSKELRPRMGEHLFGCDDCQSVCPFNRTRPPEPEKTRAYSPLPAWTETDLEAVVRNDDARFIELTTGSPVKRATRRGLARNAVIVSANRLAKANGSAPIDGGAKESIGIDEARRALTAALASADPVIADLAKSELSRVERDHG